MKAGIGTLLRMCCVPSEGANMPVMMLARVGAHTADVE